MSDAKLTVQSLIDQLRAQSDKGVRLPNLVEVAEGLGISRTVARDGAARGTVPALRIGGRWKSTREALQAWRDQALAYTDRIPAHRKSAPAASVRQRELDDTDRELAEMGVEVDS